MSTPNTAHTAGSSPAVRMQQHDETLKMALTALRTLGIPERMCDASYLKLVDDRTSDLAKAKGKISRWKYREIQNGLPTYRWQPRVLLDAWRAADAQRKALARATRRLEDVLGEAAAAAAPAHHHHHYPDLLQGFVVRRRAEAVRLAHVGAARASGGASPGAERARGELRQPARRCRGLELRGRGDGGEERRVRRGAARGRGVPEGAGGGGVEAAARRGA